MRKALPSYFFEHEAIAIFLPLIDKEYLTDDTDIETLKQDYRINDCDNFKRLIQFERKIIERAVDSMQHKVPANSDQILELLHVKLLSDAAMHRILAEVGEKHVPNDLDREVLKIGLEVIRDIQHNPLFSDQQSGTMQSNELPKKLKRALNCAQRLEKILDDPDIAEELSVFRREGEQDPREAISRCERELHDVINLYLKKRITARRDYIFGRYLPDVWREHFGCEPGYSTHPTTGMRTGPYVRFARAVARECYVRRPDGREWSDDTLLKGIRAPSKE